MAARCFLLLAIIASANKLTSSLSVPSTEEEFAVWMRQYGKSYSNKEEYQFRLKVFTQNYLDVEQHNKEVGHTYELEANHFADLTFEEFKARYLMEPQHCSATVSDARPHLFIEPPVSIDWRDKGAITPVKTQGECGSCWTFSTTGCLEAHHFLKTNQLVSLSEQQLVDCAGAFNNKGCHGGLPSQAFEYIRYNGGLESEKDYPYRAHDEVFCHFNKSRVSATVVDVVNITKGDEQTIYNAVGTIGPVSIAYDVSSDFRFYKKGVYSSTKCKTDAEHVNHAVLAVGYNTDDHGTPYWIVKNSWGTKFGIDGYFWMKRGANMCGLADCASYPVV